MALEDITIGLEAELKAQRDPDVLGGVFPEQEVAEVFPSQTVLSELRSPEQKNRTAMLASLAMVKQGRVNLDELENTAKTNVERLDNEGEEELRSEIDDFRKAELETGIYQDVTDMGYQLTLEDDRYSLEEQGVDQMVGMSYSDLNQALVNEGFPDLVERNRDYSAKVAILQNLADEFGERYENDPAALNIVDWLATIVPFNETTRISSALRGLTEDVPFYDIGLKKEVGRQRLFDLPIEDFKVAVDGMRETLSVPEIGQIMNNNVLNEQILRDLIQGTDRFWDNAFELMDVADVITPIAIAPFLKAQKNPLRMAKTVNRGLATDTAVGRILQTGQVAADEGIVKMSHAIDMLLPDNARTTNELAVGLSGDVVRKIDENQALLRELIEENPSLHRLRGDAADEAIFNQKARLEAQFKPGQISDVKVIGHDELTGLQQVDIYMGKANGTGGFKSQAMAERSAKQRQLLNYRITQDESGQFFIRQRHAVPEEGFVPGFDPEEVGRTGLRAEYTPFTYWGPKDLASVQVQAANQQLRFNKVINKKILPQIDKLNGASKRRVEDILELAHKEEKWFNHTEFKQTYQAQHGKFPSGDELNAYFAYKELNDFDWLVLNNKTYTDLARQGYNKIEIPKLSFEGNGKLLSDLPDVEGMRLYDATKKISYDPKNPLTKDEFQKLVKDNEYVVYKLNSRSGLPNVGNEHVDIVIGKRGEFGIGSLDYHQLPYKPGGHRIYPRNSLFVKQGRVMTRTDGSRYMMDALTHAISPSMKEADTWAKKMEDLRLGVVEYRKGKIGIDELDDLFEGTEIKDLDMWDRMIDEGTLVENTPFEVVFDGEMPKSMTEAIQKPGVIDDFTDDVKIDDATKYLMNRNRKYTGFRGEHLLGPDGERAQILTPFEALNEALQHANRTGAYNNYRVEAMESWHRTFKEYLKDGGQLTPNQALFNPSWKDDAPADIIAKATSVRNNIVRQLSLRTKQSQKSEAFKRSVAAWVEGKSGVDFRVTKDMLDKDFLRGYRSWARNIYQGFANPGQFLLQAQTAVAATMISPLAGLEAWKSLPTMRFALYAGDDVIEKMAKHTVQTGMEPENFKQMVKMAQNSGFLDVGDEAFIFARSMPTKIGTGRLEGVAATTADWAKRTSDLVVNDVGNSVLREAERVNRIVSWQIAYREALREAGEQGLKDTPELAAQLLNRANTLSFDMNSAGRTALQGGWEGLVGQFLQYGVNYGDLIFNPFNKTLSAAEKVRVIFGTSLLYGGNAVPWGRDMMDVAADKYTEATGKTVDDVTYRAMTSGGFDALIYTMTGGEIDPSFGTRAGYDGFVQGIQSAVTDKSVMEAAMGPGFSANYNLATAVWDNLNYLAKSTVEGTLSGEDLGQAFLDLARVTKTGSDIDKALTLRKGMLATKSGMRLSEGNSMESVAALLGIPLRQEVDSWRMYESERDEKELVNSIAKKMVENNSRAMFADTQDEVDYFARVNNFLLQGESVQVQNKIVSEMMRRNPKDFYWEMAQRRLRTQPLSNIGQAAIDREQRRTENNE